MRERILRKGSYMSKLRSAKRFIKWEPAEFERPAPDERYHKKTNTGLSIAAFVVSLFSLIFAPLSIISIILIIIDAVKNKNKKRKKGLWIAELVISIIMIITLFVPKSDSNDAEQPTVVQENSNSDVSEGADPIETEIPKEYIEVTADDLVDALNSNAMKAQNDYLDKYLQITGTLGTIDSSGKYISIDSEQFSLATIQCYMTSELSLIHI